MIRIDGYLTDGCLSEEEQLESQITDFPTESGAVKSDHINNLPITLEVEFVVSDTPIGDAASARDAGVVPTNEARAFLTTLWEARRPFNVEVGGRAYPDMVFTSLRFPRDSQTGDALRATASLRRFEVVEVRRVSVALTKRRRGVARGKKGASMWLCPPGWAVSASDAENRRNKCRRVETRSISVNGDPWNIKPSLVFADNGKELTDEEKSRLMTQQLNTKLGAADVRLSEFANYDPVSRQWIVPESDRPAAKHPDRATIFKMFTGVDESYEPPSYPPSSDPLVNGINALGRGQVP